MADHEDYLPGEAPAAHHESHEDDGTDEISIAGLSGEPAELAAHAALPTVHQDAPALISTHKGDAAAHHPKYTDVEAKAVHAPLSVHPAAFIALRDTYNWRFDVGILRNRTALTLQYFYAPVYFPNGVTVTKLTLYGFRDDIDASMLLLLYRVDRIGGESDMATCITNWISGYSSREDNTIDLAVIDNTNYSYMLQLRLNPNDSALDVRFSGAKIDFTG